MMSIVRCGPPPQLRRLRVLRAGPRPRSIAEATPEAPVLRTDGAEDPLFGGIRRAAARRVGLRLSCVGSAFDGSC